MTTATARKPRAAATAAALPLPKLAKAEILVGAFLGADGRGHWTILMTGDKAFPNWRASMDDAKKRGGDNPNRIEQAALHARHKDEFKPTAYWSNTPHADDARFAWGQNFGIGYQLNWHQDSKLRARAVRRVPLMALLRSIGE